MSMSPQDSGPRANDAALPHGRRDPAGARASDDRNTQQDTQQGTGWDTALARASEEVVVRLDRRGVRLSGRETNEQLVDLLDAVERFELITERAGADLLVDEPVHGTLAPVKPDDRAFVLPVRLGSESVADFIERVVDATAGAERVHRQRHTHDPRPPHQRPAC